MINVAMYAQVRKVKVLIQRDCQNIRIHVEYKDVGLNSFEVGFSLDRTYRFDLFSIREQLDYLGGHIEIESEPDYGTRVTLLAPLKCDKEITKEKMR